MKRRDTLLIALLAVVLLCIKCVAIDTRAVAGETDSNRLIFGAASHLLPQDVFAGYKRLAQSAGVDMFSLLGFLPQDLIGRREYSSAETAGALASLWQIATRARIGEPIASAASHFPQTGKESLYVFVDPTCSTCRHVIDVVRSYQRSHPHSPVAFLPRPDEDELSLHAAAVLAYAATNRDERTYLELLFELAEQLPQTKVSVDRIAEAILDLDVQVDDLPALSRSRMLMEHWNLMFRGLPAGPVVVFHGRVLERSTYASPGFDPLQNEVTLDTSMELIKRYDNTEKTQ